LIYCLLTVFASCIWWWCSVIWKLIQVRICMSRWKEALEVSYQCWATLHELWTFHSFVDCWYCTEYHLKWNEHSIPRGFQKLSEIGKISYPKPIPTEQVSSSHQTRYQLEGRTGPEYLQVASHYLLINAHSKSAVSRRRLPCWLSPSTEILTFSAEKAHSPTTPHTLSKPVMIIYSSTRVNPGGIFFHLERIWEGQHSWFRE